MSISRMLDFHFTKDGNTVRLMESWLTDNSAVYDIEIVDLDEVIFKTSAYDKEDAEIRFDYLTKALQMSLER